MITLKARTTKILMGNDFLGNDFYGTSQGDSPYTPSSTVLNPIGGALQNSTFGNAMNLAGGLSGWTP